MIESAKPAQRITSTVAVAMGEEPTREHRPRGTDVDWDQAVADAITQTAQALKSKSET
jgi:hypothetical protein